MDRDMIYIPYPKWYAFVMSEIYNICARQILDSRGYPTVEAEVVLEEGCWGRASVPSGASTGAREALELRDGNDKYYRGKSVLLALNNIQEVLKPLLEGKKAQAQAHIDSLMRECDGTPFKTRLGANSILAVSLAVARAAASSERVSLYRYLNSLFNNYHPNEKFVLPTVLMNVINGGRHASNGLDIQEFMLVPHLQGSFTDNLRAGVEIFHTLRENLLADGHSVNVGDEGGGGASVDISSGSFGCFDEGHRECGLSSGGGCFPVFGCSGQ